MCAPCYSTHLCICSDVTTEEVNETVGPEDESCIQDLICNLHENVITSGITFCLKIVISHWYNYENPLRVKCQWWGFIHAHEIRWSKWGAYACMWWEVLVLVSNLIQLLRETCRVPSCSAAMEDIRTVHCGYGVKLECKCVEGHGKWYSSPIYGSGFAVLPA